MVVNSPNSYLQAQLVGLEWPEALLDHPGAAEEWGDVNDKVIYKGMSSLQPYFLQEQ